LYEAAGDLILSKKLGKASDAHAVIPGGDLWLDHHLSKRHVCFHVGKIHFCHEGNFTEVPLPLTILVLQQVALAFFTAQELACGSEFEAFGNGFSGFG
jgi:hypothetical protein